MTGSTLTAEQQAAYDRDGYFTVRKLFDGEEIAEGQGEHAGQPEDVDLPAFLTADLPDSDASMMAAE